MDSFTDLSGFVKYYILQTWWETIFPESLMFLDSLLSKSILGI